MHPDVQRLQNSARAPLTPSRDAPSRKIERIDQGEAVPESDAAVVAPQGVVLVGADTVTPHTVAWGWAGRIPLKGVTVLCGQPDLGKSTLAFKLAAMWSRGTAEGSWFGSPVRVLIASSEDCKETTMVPRLMAAAADLTRIKFVEVHHDGLTGNLVLPDSLADITLAMQKAEARVLIIDPLFGHLNHDLNAHRDQDIRQVMAPLAHLAEKRDGIVLTVAHLNKRAETDDVLTRIGGSMALPAAARSVLLAGHHPDEPESNVKMLAHVKCNVGPRALTLRYELQRHVLPRTHPPIETSSLTFCGEAVGVFGADLLSRDTREERSARSEAKAWLLEFLGEGSKSAETIREESAKIGITKATLRRASEELHIVKVKERGLNGPWTWHLPPPVEDAHAVMEEAHTADREHLPLDTL